MIDVSVFVDLYRLGLKPIPVKWDEEKKCASQHPIHQLPETDFNEGWLHHQLSNGLSEANGMAIKLFPPFGMFDFDVKNTNNKEVFNQWRGVIEAERPDILKKLVIETTKSDGFHAYIKYPKLTHKIAIARSEGREVISVYTGGLLSYCAPTPGYNIFHNDFNDLVDLTDDEYDYLVAMAGYLNEDPEHVPGNSTIKLIQYPTEYENICMQFDEKCDDTVFDLLLNSIDLFEVKDNRQFKNKKWSAYLRNGSTGAYSAKVYFKSKRVLIFSASFTGFPTWHDSAKCGDDTWSLTPSKIIYYKNKSDWSSTLEEINIICDSAGIEINIPEKKKQLISEEDSLKFPYDIFPIPIQNYISQQKIQKDYMAGACLAALSACIGNSAVLKAMDGWYVKPIVYMVLVAPPGASKSPGMKKAFAPLHKFEDILRSEHANKMAHYKEQLNEYEKDKKNNDKPEIPPRKQVVIGDSTIEMVVKILSDNSMGCVVYADEFAGFLNRMNKYNSGDELEKWLEMWSGGSILLQRITREDNYVKDAFCSIIGGIQTGLLPTLSENKNEHNGFYHRFLFIYPVPDKKGDFSELSIPYIIEQEFDRVFMDMLEIRTEKMFYIMSEEAKELYANWYNEVNFFYNSAHSDNIKGIIAKYQDYCLRFSLLLQCANEGVNRTGYVDKNNMERAIRLTSYFFRNMQKALQLLTPDAPADKLPEPYKTIYAALPEMCSTKTIVEACMLMKIKDSAAKMFINRNINKLFKQISRGNYEKMY